MHSLASHRGSLTRVLAAAGVGLQLEFPGSLQKEILVTLDNRCVSTYEENRAIIVTTDLSML